MLLAQCGQRFAQARAAGEIGDRHAGRSEHGVGVGQPEGRREVGQLGSESENVAAADPAMAAAGGRMQERQQQARVALHRARHVHQHQ